MKKAIIFLAILLWVNVCQANGLSSTSGSQVSVTAGTPDIVITPNPGVATFTVGTAVPVNAQAGTTPYAIVAGDMGKLVTHNKSSAVAVTLPQAGTTGFALGVSFSDINTGSGLVTITPATSTINGAATLTLGQNQGAWIVSDGSNWTALIGKAAVAGTGLAYSGSTLNSNAVYQVAFQPGLITAVTNTKGVYGKVSNAATVDNIEGSAITFTCAGNPTITFYECGTSATCASSPTTIGSVTVTASGQVFDGVINSAVITAGDYIAWAISAGTCTALDISTTAQLHSN